MLCMIGGLWESLHYKIGTSWYFYREQDFSCFSSFHAWVGTGRGFGRYKGGGWESQGWHVEWIPEACVKITKGLALQTLYSQYLKLL